MEDIRVDRTPCHIKVVVNPAAEESFTVRWAYATMGRQVNVKIIISNIQQLSKMVTHMKENLGQQHFDYNVNFNWKNAPSAIRQDGHFKTEMYRLFGNQTRSKTFITPEQLKRWESGDDEHAMVDAVKSVDPEKYATFAKHIRTHMVDYGAHPNMSLRTPKGVKKITSYIRSVLGMPHMTTPEAIAIADVIIA